MNTRPLATTGDARNPSPSAGAPPLGNSHLTASAGTLAGSESADDLHCDAPRPGSLRNDFQVEAQARNGVTITIKESTDEQLQCLEREWRIPASRSARRPPLLLSVQMG